ncbi:MAG: pseudouridine synthase [Albidovulum sp.]
MTEEKTSGDRIAKVMARAGVASRRDAERMIIEGRVAVNGKAIQSPALDILPTDRVTVDGKPIDAPQPARLWLYYKPLGLVSSNKDEKGRQTVFDTLPKDMPRVNSVGRLDINSEGLLLLTNDGGLKRRLELPSTGWLRKYRVRVNGRPNDATFDPLRRGVQVEGEDFLPMEVSLDRQQGANAWLTVGLREGKNREIRRAMTEVGMIVNRLIRVSYGPFRLNTMKPGDVVEVKQRILREQLGETGETEPGGTAAPKRKTGPGVDHKSRNARHDGKGPDRKGPDRKGSDAKAYDRGPRAPRPQGDGGERKPRAAGAEGAGFTRKPRPEGRSDPLAGEPGAGRANYERKSRPARDGVGGGDGKPRGPRPGGGGSVGGSGGSRGGGSGGGGSGGGGFGGKPRTSGPAKGRDGPASRPPRKPGTK